MKTYSVGGSVRDELLGLAVQDRDHVVVGADPAQMLERGDAGMADVLDLGDADRRHAGGTVHELASAPERFLPNEVDDLRVRDSQ